MHFVTKVCYIALNLYAAYLYVDCQISQTPAKKNV